MNNTTFQKQASPVGNVIGATFGGLGGAGLGAATGGLLTSLLGGNRDQQVWGLLGGGLAGGIGGGILGAKGVSRALERQQESSPGWEDDLMNAADQVQDSMKREGLDRALSPDAYRKEFERRFNSSFDADLDQTQKAFLQRYIGKKSASCRYSAAQMLGLPGRFS